MWHVILPSREHNFELQGNVWLTEQLDYIRLIALLLDLSLGIMFTIVMFSEDDFTSQLMICPRFYGNVAIRRSSDIIEVIGTEAFFMHKTSSPQMEIVNS